MATYFPYSKLENHSFIFKETTWEIPNVLSLPKLVDTVIRSTEFTFANGTWVLYMYPFGQKKYKTKSYIDIIICRQQSCLPSQQIFYNIFFKTHCGKKEYRPFKSCQNFTSQNDKSGVIRFMPYKKFASEQKTLLDRGILTIVCQLRTRCSSPVEEISRKEVVIEPDISIKCEFPIQATISKETFTTASDNKVLCDFQNLLTSGECTDMTILVKEHEFKAHRAILCARSSVFASILKHDAEKNTRTVEVEACNPEDFPAFLHFLYSGSIEKLTSQNMYNLYRVSDKYDVQDLKSECLTLMKKHLTVDNFCNVFDLALQYSETDLIMQSTEFFKRNLSKIIVTSKWQEFLSKNTAVGNDLFIKALVVDENSNPSTCA